MLMAESDLVHYRANEYGKGAGLIGLSMWRLKESAVKETMCVTSEGLTAKVSARPPTADPASFEAQACSVHLLPTPEKP